MILPAITTITSGEWKNRVREAGELGLKEIILFPTCLSKKERRDLYELLDKAGVKKVPFVHLRSDMAVSELDYLTKKYKTEVFNIHTNKEYPIKYDYKNYKKIIYIENTYYSYDEEEIKKFAGVCLDFAHLENAKIFNPNVYRRNIELIEKYKCGCNHISPLVNFSLFKKRETELKNHPHVLQDLHQLNYLKVYPRRYFSSFIALEMENSISEQLEALKYIKKLLPGNGEVVR